MFIADNRSPVVPLQIGFVRIVQSVLSTALASGGCLNKGSLHSSFANVSGAIAFHLQYECTTAMLSKEKGFSALPLFIFRILSLFFFLFLLHRISLCPFKFLSSIFRTEPPGDSRRAFAFPFFHFPKNSSCVLRTLRPFLSVLPASLSVPSWFPSSVSSSPSPSPELQRVV